MKTILFQERLQQISLKTRILEIQDELSKREYEGFEKHEYMYKYKKSFLLKELKEKKDLLKLLK